MSTSILEELSARTTKELVSIFNRITQSEVKRFATKGDGLKRLAKAITDATVAAKLDAILGIQATTVAIIEEFDDGTPIEDAGVVITRAAVETAKKTDAPQPIEGHPTLVSYRGKIINKENISRVKKGEVLWGETQAPPAKNDQLKGAWAQINLNYPPKAKIVEPRDGSMRQKLIRLMAGKGKGVTIEQVAKLFGITEQAAIYKIRDLHYVGGHGLRVKKGRVFAYGEITG